MRRRSMPTIVAVAVLTLGAGVAVAAEGGPATLFPGEVGLTFNAGIKPKTLAKTALTPVSAFFEGEVQAVDGGHPPALGEMTIETDRNIAIDVKGYPLCPSPLLKRQNSAQAELTCKDAMLGKGSVDIEIQFPEQAPVPVHSPLILFNGGEKGGVITLYMHVYITVPTPATLVIPVKVTRIHDGRYGIRSVVSVPKIAGGSGSVTAFRLDAGKRFTYKGKKVSFIGAKCPDGKIQFRAAGAFVDGATASAEVVRTCTGKG